MGFVVVVAACAVCASAERGLPANGAEAAFDGRKRATLDLRAAGFASTAGPDTRVVELRAEVGAAATIATRTMLSIALPALRRSVANDAGARAGSDGVGSGAARRDETLVGDAELRLAHSAVRAVGRHLSLDGGVKLPTAPVEHDARGATLSPDLQPGCSSVVPFVSATYAWSGALVSAWTSASLLMPVGVRPTAPHPGDSARVAATLQLQPGARFATRLGAHARYDTTGESDGAAVPRSGGGAVHVAPQIVLTPATDVVVSFGAAFPLVQAMRGYRATSPVALASVGIDF